MCEKSYAREVRIYVFKCNYVESCMKIRIVLEEVSCYSCVFLTPPNSELHYTELHYSSKKREHSLSILKSFFVGRKTLFSMLKERSRFFKL